MLPLASISQAQALLPRPEIVAPETLPMRLPGAGAVAPVGTPREITPGQPASESFGSLLGRLVGDVNSKQNAAASAMQALQTGGDVSLHQAVIAMEEASVSFQLMVEVRNKLLESYQEIMRMQI